MLRVFVPIVFLLALVGAVVLVDRPLPRADFVFVNRGDVTTLDPAQMSWQQDLRVARLLFEGLTRSDVFSRDYEAMPGVAERWDVAENGRTYTFHLRRDARWSNGRPVTAGDFVYSWRRALLPEVGSDYVNLFQLIKGGKAFYDWRAAALAEFAAKHQGSDLSAAGERLWQETLTKFDELVGLKAVDDHTLVVELERPTPYFLDLTSFAVLHPLYPPLVQAYESIDPRTGRLKTRPDWTKPPNLVGNGPFVLTVWRFKRDMRLEKNPHYWRAGELNIDSIGIPTIEDPNAQVLAFRTGAVQWVSDVLPVYRADMLDAKAAFYREHQEEYNRLKADGWDPVEIDRRLPPDPRLSIHAYPAFGLEFYNFNCKPKLADGRDNPFHSPLVRRAFALSVDKEAIVKSIRRAGEPAAATLIPPGSLKGYRSPKGLEFDPQEGRRLLAQAGYPDGKGFITVELLFSKDGGHDLIVQSVAKNWEEHLGVRVMLAQKEVKVFRDDLKNTNFMVSRGSWFGDYGDATTFLDLNRTGDGNNDRKYSNAAYDALLDRAQEERDPEARLRILEEAERILVEDDLPLIPMFVYSQIYLFDPHAITGFSSHPRQLQNLFLVDVLGDGKGSDNPMVMERNKN